MDLVVCAHGCSRFVPISLGDASRWLSSLVFADNLLCKCLGGGGSCLGGLQKHRGAAMWAAGSWSELLVVAAAMGGGGDRWLGYLG